jgi:hypothetical protein
MSTVLTEIRAAGTSVTDAMRHLILDLAAQRHPLSGLREGVHGFCPVVAASPALLAAARTALETLEVAVAAAIAESSEPSSAPVDARLLAGSLVAPGSPGPPLRA